MKRLINYQIGALKRKYKTGKDAEPGTFISKVNENKKEIINNNQSVSKKKLSIMGLV